jgi:GTP cyclohydrolase I
MSENSCENMDMSSMTKAVRELLIALGEDPDRPGLAGTPGRVGRMYAELFHGLHADAREHLTHYFQEDYDEIVCLRNIPFHSICEHHLMPFLGRAHVAYLPDKRVVGVSKLARVVDTLAHQPQVQERLTKQIADLLHEELQARGVAVMMEATHTCMTIRGVHKPGSIMVTSAIRGLFRTNLASRNEVMSLLRGHTSEL